MRKEAFNTTKSGGEGPVSSCRTASAGRGGAKTASSVAVGSAASSGTAWVECPTPTAAVGHDFLRGCGPGVVHLPDWSQQPVFAGARASLGWHAAQVVQISASATTTAKTPRRILRNMTLCGQHVRGHLVRAAIGDPDLGVAPADPRVLTTSGSRPSTRCRAGSRTARKPPRSVRMGRRA